MKKVEINMPSYKISGLLTATARRMPRPVDGDEGGRMEIEIYFLCSQEAPPCGRGSSLKTPNYFLEVYAAGPF